MTFFVSPEVLTDQASIKAKAVATMEAELTGWRLVPGSLEDVLFDAWSQVASEYGEVLISQLTSAFRSLGPLFGVPPIEAQSATSIATFTMIDAAGYSVPPNAVVLGIRDATATLQAFRLVTELVVKAGETTGTATVEAIEPGEAANGLTGATQLIEAPPSIVSATVATTGNGVNAEDDLAFLNRFTEALALVKPAPVKAADAAVIARSVAGVGRATAVDNLIPSAAHGGEGGADVTNAEKAITVAATDVNGIAVDATHLAAIKTLLESLRESNFLFYVIKPLYMKIDVTATVYAWPGRELAAVKASVEEALANFLSPARWATDASGIAARWANNSLVRKGDLYSAIESAPGVRWCSALTFGKHGGALAEADVDMAAGTPIPALPDVTGNADGTKTPATFTITVLAST